MSDAPSQTTIATSQASTWPNVGRDGCPRDEGGFCRIALMGRCKWTPERPECGKRAERCRADRSYFVDLCAQAGKSAP